MSYYEELKALAGKHSDHEGRIVNELEPALKDSPSDFPFLEIGNREGGSAMIILAYMNKNQEFVTADTNPSPPLIDEWTDRLGIKHTHFQGSQEDFVKRELAYRWGFIFLDADHDQVRVTRDIEILKGHMVKGAILVVDDVQGWTSLPEFDGLERVDYKVNEGGEPTKTGHHVIYFRKL